MLTSGKSWFIFINLSLTPCSYPERTHLLDLLVYCTCIIWNLLGAHSTVVYDATCQPFKFKNQLCIGQWNPVWTPALIDHINCSKLVSKLIYLFHWGLGFCAEICLQLKLLGSLPNKEGALLPGFLSALLQQPWSSCHPVSCSIRL
jgi:hypothetical protein